MDLRGERSVGQKGNCQLCGQHYIEFNFILPVFVVNEEFHNAENAKTPTDAEYVTETVHYFHAKLLQDGKFHRASCV